MPAAPSPQAALAPSDLIFISEAARYIERPSFLLQLTNSLGQPLERGLKLLPKAAERLVQHATQSALKAALRVAIASLPKQPPPQHSFSEAIAAAKQTRLRHDFAAAAAGAAGGLFGLAALLVELPVTTTLMLRSIARVATIFGEDLTQPAARLDCLFVFSAGGGSPNAEAAESGYYSSRLAFASLVKEAAAFVGGAGAREAAHAVSTKSAPALLKLLVPIAARFELVVSDKLIAQLVPIAGAASGAAVNIVFSEHFESLARYHFGLRRLEREHGTERVQAAYAAAHDKHS
jgi:hypothetical protein